MPLLDVSDILSDPDFADEITITRTIVRVERGRTKKDQTEIPTVGVVTSDQGDILDRLPDMRRVAGTILVHTTETLVASDGERDADIIEWAGKQYTVVDVNDYSRYGAGFTCAKCEPLRLV
ncbi:hypothetical protein [Ochrobactrum chromiisoli]|uniref:Head-tail adaptor n=1 Tax=Ochrobactrum chromiisoli TaxID=2993941 RepID=A0ABT3QUE0_9HYPH|nr:hypothetical protein [Ochrobactrum chromiisoli]MCX2699253.1 hypothetical protein [Ochrobactrum chromiisoli]